MATHKVTISVVLTMDEMDGSVEESAEVALDLTSEAIRDTFPPGEVTDVFVHDYAEVSES